MPARGDAMTASEGMRDVTGTVALDDPRAVADATAAILARTYGAAFDAAVLHDAFAYAAQLFGGRLPGYLACDMPYHDLRHSHDAALAAARLVDGRVRTAGAAALPADAGTAAVVLALLHDTGFLRTRAESAQRGPQFAAVHESRSVAVADAYLRRSALAHRANLSPMIMATRVAERTAPLYAGREDDAIAVGCILGTADLLCQVADPRYLERCYHHLYAELALGAAEGGAAAFRDARDLVARTPAFCTSVVEPRLAGDLRGAAATLGAHFGGHDPYAASVRTNVDRCRRIVDDDRWELLGPPPPTTTTGLHPAYRAGA
ncbi:MAG: hypothetical protein BroJett026_08780 [Betaproteobacteria bacterium]|nr:MAG: hypothetical protein BroJett026_08780 [Betaproteobacteria bacterium]